MEQKQEILVEVEYEHRRGGALVSRGRQRVDEEGQIHYFQEDEKGRCLIEVICAPDGTVLEVVGEKFSLPAKIGEFVSSLVKRSSSSREEDSHAT